MRSHIVPCPACGRRNRLPSGPSGQPVCRVCHAPLAWVAAASDADFDSLTAGSLPVLVDLWAPWCGPCIMLGPAIDSAAAQLAGQIKVVKVNVDHAPTIAARFAVQSIPTLVLLRDGVETGRWVGAAPAGALLAWIRPQITSQAA